MTRPSLRTDRPRRCRPRSRWPRHRFHRDSGWPTGGRDISCARRDRVNYIRRQAAGSLARLPALVVAEPFAEARHTCNVCNWSGARFYPNTGPGYHERATTCPGCSSLDRHRSLVAVLRLRHRSSNRNSGRGGRSDAGVRGIGPAPAGWTTPASIWRATRWSAATSPRCATTRTPSTSSSASTSSSTSPTRPRHFPRSTGCCVPAGRPCCRSRSTGISGDVRVRHSRSPRGRARAPVRARPPIAPRGSRVRRRPGRHPGPRRSGNHRTVRIVGRTDLWRGIPLADRSISVVVPAHDEAGHRATARALPRATSPGTRSWWRPRLHGRHGGGGAAGTTGSRSWRVSRREAGSAQCGRPRSGLLHGSTSMPTSW